MSQRVPVSYRLVQSSSEGRVRSLGLGAVLVKFGVKRGALPSVESDKPFDITSRARFTNVVRVRRSLINTSLWLLAGATFVALGHASRRPLSAAATQAVTVSAAVQAAPVLPQHALAQRAQAQRRILSWGGLIEDANGHVVPSGQAGSLNGNALGRFVPIENEAALEPFHRSLRTLRTSPDPAAKVRIVAYGASHTQGDVYTGYLRYYLQSRFGNGGLGFIPFGLRKNWSRRFGFKLETHGLDVEYAQSGGKAAEAGFFGLAGAAAVGQHETAAKVFPSNLTEPELRGSNYEFFYLAEPGGADVAVSVDGEPPVQLSGSAPTPQARYHAFVEHPGWHTVRVKSVGQGTSRWFGLSVERSGPGVVVDTLGIRGTRAANLLRWDQNLWFEQLRRRDPTLVLLAYGTNEANDTSEPITQYEANLREVVRRVHAAVPKASCLLVGPGDFPLSENGTWVTRPRLQQIIETQRRVALESSCGFWDSFAFMGGEGSMERWTRASPQLGAPDHIHLTVRGYVRLGMGLGDALLRAYDSNDSSAIVTR
jgi:lysophospholipase L1-like esterase